MDNRENHGVTVELIRVEGCRELESLFIEVQPVDILRAIDGWKWLSLAGLTVIATSAFGELFLLDNAGTVFQIDTIDGSLRKVATSIRELVAMLDSPQVRDDLLFEGLIAGTRNKGLILESGECYDFEIPPILGGSMGVDEIQKLPFVVKLQIAGQLHEQARYMVPGGASP